MTLYRYTDYELQEPHIYSLYITIRTTCIIIIASSVSYIHTDFDNYLYSIWPWVFTYHSLYGLITYYYIFTSYHSIFGMRNVAAMMA